MNSANLTSAAPANPSVDLTVREVEANRALDALITCMTELDADAVDQLVVRDDDFVAFGTDASERWAGHDVFMAATRAQFEAFESSAVELHDRVLHVHSSGDVAWFSAHADWTISMQGQSMTMTGLRMTGVLERRDGRWLHAQFHLSKPVEGQAVEY